MATQKIIFWLYTCCFMVFAMAVIGAVTRLTESGLSITVWEPVTGTIPPLTAAEWERAFALYQESPEFIHKHSWMTLEDFKKIYFWEWLHRLWGRTIGLVFLLPLLWFAFKKQLPAGYGRHFAGLLLLGGAQGFMGWYMVQSGLVDRPYVSHYRLAAHLALALVIFGWLWWLALDLKHKFCRSLPEDRQTARRPALLWHSYAALVLLAVTIIWGAFVAGLRAGMIYNEFPLMGGQIMPPEVFYGLASIFDQPGWVQFCHRWLAMITGAIVLWLSWRTADKALALMMILQIGLGIATLLTQVSLVLAALHQAGAVILLALLLQNLYRAHHGLIPGSAAQNGAYKEKPAS